MRLYRDTVVVELIPSALSYSTSVIFGQHRNIQISSNITFQCNQTSLMTMQWTIFICSSMCSNVLQLDQSIELSGKDLLIGAEILSSGVYKVELIVTMVDDPLLFSSAFTYIEITRSIVIINLISFNATKFEQNIEFN